MKTINQGRELKREIKSAGMVARMDIADVAELDDAGEYTGRVVEMVTVTATVTDAKTGNVAVAEVDADSDIDEIKTRLTKQLRQRAKRTRKLATAWDEMHA